MKIRIGFVSNSSSSSFILASPLEGDALQEKLKKVFQLNSDVLAKSYPIKAFAFNPGKCIYEICKMLYDDNLSLSTKEEYLNEVCSTEEEACKSEQHSKNLALIEKGFIVYLGDFSDQPGDLDQILYDAEILYEDSELYIYQDPHSLP